MRVRMVTSVASTDADRETPKCPVLNRYYETVALFDTTCLPAKGEEFVYFQEYGDPIQRIIPMGVLCKVDRVIRTIATRRGGLDEERDDVMVWISTVDRSMG